MIVKKVLITKCKDRRWYSDYVGQEWGVIEDCGIEYKCRAADGYLNFILKEDCEPTRIDLSDEMNKINEERCFEN